VKNKLYKDGFTLVEILVAVALITAILSMVYGSYFATSKSAQACKAKIAMFQQGRKTLEQMAQQIRCSYAGTDAEHTDSMPSDSYQIKMIPEKNINFFNGDSDAPGGEILHLVTTNGFFKEKVPVDGLFDVTYKFDKGTGVLSLRQIGFIGTVKRLEEGDYRPIACNIERLELTFFDGQQWLRSWDFEDQIKLPYAVKIEIGFEDENYQRCDYVTVANVFCRENEVQTRTETLVSINER
jgi:prepilin-type N-terminal cleavage/methylation domain-containing protein